MRVEEGRSSRENPGNDPVSFHGHHSPEQQLNLILSSLIADTVNAVWSITEKIFSDFDMFPFVRCHLREWFTVYPPPFATSRVLNNMGPASSATMVSKDSTDRVMREEPRRMS